MKLCGRHSPLYSSTATLDSRLFGSATKLRDQKPLYTSVLVNDDLLVALVGFTADTFEAPLNTGPHQHPAKNSDGWSPNSLHRTQKRIITNSEQCLLASDHTISETVAFALNSQRLMDAYTSCEN